MNFDDCEINPLLFIPFNYVYFPYRIRILLCCIIQVIERKILYWFGFHFYHYQRNTSKFPVIS